MQKIQIDQNQIISFKAQECVDMINNLDTAMGENNAINRGLLIRMTATFIESRCFQIVQQLQQEAAAKQNSINEMEKNQEIK